MSNILENGVIDTDVSVGQILHVKKKREERRKAERIRKLNRLKLRIGQALAVTLFVIISVMLITCVVTGAMYLSGGIR